MTFIGFLIKEPPKTAKERMERIIEVLERADHLKHDDIRVLIKWLEEFKEQEL